MEEKRDRKVGLIVISVLLVVLLVGGTVLYNTLLGAVESATPTAEPSAQQPVATPVPQAQSETKEEAKPAEVAGPRPRANLAKDFAVYTDAGEEVRLIDMRGKPTVVNFFASWCGPCKMEMPHFDEAYKAYGDTINFMMVNLCAFGNDTKENGKAMVEAGGWTFPVYFDTEGDAAVAYSVRSMPTTIFVSADGELVSTRVGALSKQALQSEIDKLLAK